MNRHTRLIARCALFGFTALALSVSSASTAAMQSDPAAMPRQIAVEDRMDNAEEAPRVEVALGTIDLTTDGGLGEARQKIGGAARAVCRHVVDVDGLHLQNMACVHTARDQAYRQLETFRQQALAQRAAAGSVQLARKAP